MEKVWLQMYLICQHDWLLLRQLSTNGTMYFGKQEGTVDG